MKNRIDFAFKEGYKSLQPVGDKFAEIDSLIIGNLLYHF
jgi:hypothetical protein